MAKQLLLTLVLFSSAAADEPWQWRDDASEADAVSVLLMGDTNLQGRDRPADAYRHVRATLLDADVRFANLEVALAGHSRDPLVDDIPHKNWMHSEPDQVAALTSVEMSGVGVANNVNYPWQAVMRSLAVLDNAGIATVGGGENLNAAHRPLIIDQKDTQIGFLQYAATVFPFNHAATEQRPGIAQIKVHTAYQPPKNLDKPGQPPIVLTWADPASLARMKDDIRRLAGVVDAVIVSYHWGISNSTEPVAYQSEVGRAALDAGADIVFGHGPHEYQAIELHNGKPIFHSLGQFVFDDVLRRGAHREGLLARVVLRNGDVEAISLVPSWLDDDNDVELMHPGKGKGEELFHWLLKVNGDDGAKLTLEGNEIVVNGVGAGRDQRLPLENFNDRN